LFLVDLAIGSIVATIFRICSAGVALMEMTAIIRMTARPGEREPLRQFCAPAFENTAAHPECSSFEALNCVENEDALMLIERWSSIAAHQEFIGGVIASGGLDGLADLLAAEMETLHYLSAD
jgi:quinol monooxygenase YgiN